VIVAARWVAKRITSFGSMPAVARSCSSRSAIAGRAASHAGSGVPASTQSRTAPTRCPASVASATSTQATGTPRPSPTARVPIPAARWGRPVRRRSAATSGQVT
jgi:hypothetical protein